MRGLLKKSDKGGMAVVGTTLRGCPLRDGCRQDRHGGLSLRDDAVLAVIPAKAGMTNENFSANGKLPCRGRIHATHPVDTKPGPHICGPYKAIAPSPLERAFFNSPLRGSRRGRAVCAKADSVGGHATEKSPPTGSVSGKNPLTSPTPPQGGSDC